MVKRKRHIRPSASFHFPGHRNAHNTASLAQWVLRPNRSTSRRKGEDKPE